ncbi:MAG: hypothetical protein ACOYLX_13855, partial [Burkholderiaceae bacterium]
MVDEGGETRARQVPPVGSVGGTPTDPTPPGTPPAPALAPGLALATAVVLAACGGGGGEAGPTA